MHPLMAAADDAVLNRTEHLRSPKVLGWEYATSLPRMARGAIQGGSVPLGLGCEQRHLSRQLKLDVTASLALAGAPELALAGSVYRPPISARHVKRQADSHANSTRARTRTQSTGTSAAKLPSPA